MNDQVHRYLFGVVATSSRYKFFSLQLESSTYLPLSQVRILISSRLGLDPNASAADDLSLYRFDEDLELTDPRLSIASPLVDPRTSFRITLLPESLQDVTTWIPNIEHRNVLHVLVTLREMHLGNQDARGFVPGDGTFLEDLPPPAYSHVEDHIVPAASLTRAPTVVAAVPLMPEPPPVTHLRKMDRLVTAPGTSVDVRRPGHAIGKADSPTLTVTPPHTTHQAHPDPATPEVAVSGSTYHGLMQLVTENSKDPEALELPSSVNRRRKLLLGLIIGLVITIIGGATAGFAIAKDKHNTSPSTTPSAPAPAPFQGSSSTSPTVTTTSSAASPSSSPVTWLSLSGFDFPGVLIAFASQPATSVQQCEKTCSTAAACAAASFSQNSATCTGFRSVNSAVAVAGGTDQTLVFPLNTTYLTWTTHGDTAIYAANLPLTSKLGVNFTAPDERLGGSLCSLLSSCAAFAYRSDKRVAYLFSFDELDASGSQVSQDLSTAWVKPPVFIEQGGNWDAIWPAPSSN
ncbi:hypothetical protein HKX48_002211 [Thoreauomyces humboldtii]|nr:hypothetical protein HKX48_002211 [Thoreauomyces humboldtii]